MKKHLLVIALLLSVWSAPFAQELDKQKLDQYFDTLAAHDKFMGSVAVSQNGKIVYTRSIGLADVETKKQPDAETKYRIGSISKTFTSVLVFKAVEEKKLTLAQTINKYYPTIKNADKITIAHLLNHRSGIHSFTNDSAYWQYYTLPKTEIELIEIISKGGSDFNPDAKAEYSNSNYLILSFILQKVYKKDYAKILTEKIIRPVGLTQTYYGGKINLTKNECNSYQYKSSWVKEKETDMSIPVGAGSILSTPSDLTRFAEALFNAKIISQQSLATMMTIRDNYGYGLFQIPFYEKKGYGHNGGIDGFSSVFSYFPNEKVTYALTSNGTNFDNNSISIAVLSAVFNKPYELPEFNAAYMVKAEELDQYVGVYASAQIPLKITISKADNTLMAQATGQPSFALEASAKDIFKFDRAGVVLEFNPAEKQMTLKQGGGSFLFKME